MLDLRRAIRAVGGGEPGPEGNITKLLGNELDQRLTEVAMRLLGPAAAAIDGEDGYWGYEFLFTLPIRWAEVRPRCLGMPSASAS